MRRLLANAGILAWKDDNFHYIPTGFLGVDGDTIDYIGARRPAQAYDEERDLSGRLLMPGLINCHCHAAMTLLRGIGSDLPLDKWLFDEMFPVDENDSDRKKNSVQKAKDEFMICYLRPDIAQFLNTGWGVVNAMSDMVSHSAPRRASKSYQENNWGRIMDGHKLLDRMTSLVGVR